MSGVSEGVDVGQQTQAVSNEENGIVVSDREPWFWSHDAWDQLLAPCPNLFPAYNGCAIVGTPSTPQDADVHLSPGNNHDGSDGLLDVLAGIFLDRLHPSMPFFKRSYLLDNMRLRRQDHDVAFSALIHAICALTLLQPIQATDKTLFPDREQQAEAFLSRAVRLHGSTDFGEAPSLENVLTSIFLFACQFCRGNHNAAKFRLREAAALAEIMRLGNHQSYAGLTSDERDRRLRTVLCLTMLERYVLSHPIHLFFFFSVTFPQPPSPPTPPSPLIRMLTWPLPP